MEHQKTVYMDVRKSFSFTESGKYNGGNNYVRELVRKLLKNGNSNNEVRVILICCEKSVDAIISSFSIEEDCIMRLDEITDLKVNIEDIYFCPHINDSLKYAKELEKFRKANPRAKICLTIHDRRHKELRYDKYDGLLKDGIKANSILLALGRILHSIDIEFALKRIMACADSIFTVSNYSMQSLNRIKGVKDIKYYTQSIALQSDDFSEHKDGMRYILFVSAGRPEKNFIRTLKAFEMYVKEKNDRSMKIIATGINDHQASAIVRHKIIDDDILNKQVELKGYVTDEELDYLYKNCYFLIFPSRHEGFGLPVLEALMRGKPTVASNRSSIPEVAGSAAVYVNPKSVESICHGIKRMIKDYNKMCVYLQKRKDIMRKMIELDNEVILNDLLAEKSLNE